MCIQAYAVILPCWCLCVFTLALGLTSFLPVQVNWVPLATNASLLWDDSFSLCVCVCVLSVLVLDTWLSRVVLEE